MLSLVKHCNPNRSICFKNENGGSAVQKPDSWTEQKVYLKEVSNESLIRQAPNNVEAEQAIIGSFLVNNENVNRVSDFLYPSHFYVPLHAKIYQAVLRFMERGMVATPITLKQYFENDEVLKEQGIASFDYLVKLVSSSATIVNIESLAREIHSHAVRRRLIEIGEETVNEAYDSNIEVEPMLQVEKAESLLFQLACEGETKDNIVTLKQSVHSVLKRIDQAKKSGNEIIGVDTGFIELNNMLGGGMQSSDLIIIAARPSMGKTALAVNVAINAARNFSHESDNKKKSVGFFSLEMSAEQIAARIISIKTGIEGSKIRTGKVNPEEFAAISGAMGSMSLPFYVDDTPMLSISALRTKARRMRRQHNLGLIVVDYLQLMRGSSHYDSGGRVLEIGEITNGLKAIAKELDIPVVALSQLSRAVESREDKRPQLSDLRESGNIEQDADVVMFIYRPEYYLMRKMPVSEEAQKFNEWQDEMHKVANLAEIIIAKHRNGPVGTVGLHYNGNTTGFANLDMVHKLAEANI